MRWRAPVEVPPIGLMQKLKGEFGGQAGGREKAKGPTSFITTKALGPSPQEREAEWRNSKQPQRKRHLCTGPSDTDFQKQSGFLALFKNPVATSV